MIEGEGNEQNGLMLIAEPLLNSAPDVNIITGIAENQSIE